MASKQDAQPNTLVKPTRNVQFEDPTQTYQLNMCDGAALSVKRSPLTELLWTTRACSQNSSTPVRMSKLKDECKRDIIAQSYDIEGHAQKCAERCSKWARTLVDQLHNVYPHCLDNHQIEPEVLESV